MNNETYTVLTPDGREVKFDKKTNLLIPNNEEYEKVRMRQDYLRATIALKTDITAVTAKAKIIYGPLINSNKLAINLPSMLFFSESLR